jgi:hypothetical protein
LFLERGQLFSFGLSTNGQTGQNSPEYVPLFTEIPMEKRIDKIAAGGKTSIAIHGKFIRVKNSTFLCFLTLLSGSIRSVLGENMQKLINSEKLFGDVLLKPDSGQPIFAHKGTSFPFISRTSSNIVFSRSRSTISSALRNDQRS